MRESGCCAPAWPQRDVPKDRRSHGGARRSRAAHSEGSGSRRRRWGTHRPVGRLLRVRRPIVSEERQAGFSGRNENRDDVNAALSQASAHVGAWRLRRRIATRTILVLCLPLRLHGLHAVAHRVIGRRNGLSRVIHVRTHLHGRPGRGDRRKRQRQGDQNRDDGAQAVQGKGPFKR